LTDEQAAELRAVVNSRDVPAVVATRARIVLWTAEGRMRKDLGALAGVSLPTVDRWVNRYERFGLAGLEECKRGGGRARPHRRAVPGVSAAGSQAPAGKEIHVVLDNLSTHTTLEVNAWLAANPNVMFHFKQLVENNIR
jgi:hypothetical protein